MSSAGWPVAFSAVFEACKTWKKVRNRSINWGNVHHIHTPLVHRSKQEPSGFCLPREWIQSAFTPRSNDCSKDYSWTGSCYQWWKVGTRVIAPIWQESEMRECLSCQCLRRWRQTLHWQRERSHSLFYSRLKKLRILVGVCRFCSWKKHFSGLKARFSKSSFVHGAHMKPVSSGSLQHRLK